MNNTTREHQVLPEEMLTTKKTRFIHTIPVHNRLLYPFIYLNL